MIIICTIIFIWLLKLFSSDDEVHRRKPHTPSPPTQASSNYNKRKSQRNHRPTSTYENDDANENVDENIEEAAAESINSKPASQSELLAKYVEENMKMKCIDINSSNYKQIINNLAHNSLMIVLLVNNNNKKILDNVFRQLIESKKTYIKR